MSRESGGLFSWLHISYRLLASTVTPSGGGAKVTPTPQDALSMLLPSWAP